jgi:hypothetical protein
MSFQITILKVLAGHPEGRASLPDLKRAMAILITSGSDWTDRTKRLAARAPDLDIFSQSFVLRDNAGWQITDAGRAFLDFLQTPIQPTSDDRRAPDVTANPGTAAGGVSDNADWSKSAPATPSAGGPEATFRGRMRRHR